MQHKTHLPANPTCPSPSAILLGRQRRRRWLWFLNFRNQSLQLRFANLGADNIGPILDNVSVSQVPEPASWAMLITGFGMVGFAARRRRMVAA